MSKIEKLNEAQIAQLAEYRDRWLEIGLATGPCDRPACEAAAREAYRCAGLKEPEIVIWLDSPLAGAIGSTMLVNVSVGGDQVRDQVGDQVWDQVWAQVRDQVGAQVRDQVGAQVRDQVVAQVGAQMRDQVVAQVGAQVRAQVRDQVGDQVGDQVWDQVRDQVRDQVGAQVRDQVRDQVVAQVRAQVYRCGYGEHDANWLAFYEFFRVECGLDCVVKLSGLVGLAQCGWWWPFANAVILTERPIALHRDDRGRLHRPDGLAIEYPDGWGVYAWHGLRVDRRLIEEPESYTREELAAERNSEIHRCLAERLGWDRYLELRGVSVVDRWTNVLTGLEYELLDSKERLGELEPRYLRMRSPRLHDGSQPWFIEPVDPGLLTAQAARKWQMQLSTDPTARYYRHGDICVTYAPQESLYWPDADECNNNPELRFVQET